MKNEPGFHVPSARSTDRRYAEKHRALGLRAVRKLGDADPINPDHNLP